MAVIERFGNVLGGSAFAPIEDTGARNELYLRVAMAMAILTVVFEKLLHLPLDLELERYTIAATTVGLAVACVLTPFERTSRIGVGIFAISILTYVWLKWAGYHNHGWLTVWTIPVAFLFGHAWWRDETYQCYLRMTLGIVMLGAGAQKVVAGTYFDGSFITFLSLHGDTTERAFGILCGPEAAYGSCLAHKVIGGFIVVWQFVVGILLVAGLRSLLFLFVEVAFLIGAGLYADEMNFQVLNVALLCVGFGYGMRPWLVALCLPLLLIDSYNISGILDAVF